MRWMSWLRSHESCLVGSHEVLEVDGILRGDSLGVLVKVIYMIMCLWRMEVSSMTDSVSSESSSVLSWDSTTIVADVINIILFSLLLELSKSCLSVRSLLGLHSGSETSVISSLHDSLIKPIFLIQIKCLWVLFSIEVKSGS